MDVRCVIYKINIVQIKTKSFNPIEAIKEKIILFALD